MFKKATFILVTIMLTFGLSISFQNLLAAWVPPSVDPPADNVNPPIQNESGTPATNVTTSRVLTSLNTFVANGAINLTGSDNLNLRGNWLSNDGEDEGIYVDTTGQVGIGTNVPAHDLHIKGRYYQRESIEINPGHAPCPCDTGSGSQCPYSWETNAAIGENCSDYLYSATGPTYWVYEVKSTDLVVKGNSIGIGITDPQAALEVSGAIRATELCDENGQSCNDLSGRGRRVFDLLNINSSERTCWNDIDLENECGDLDGCTIRILLMHSTLNDQVAVVEENIFMEPASWSNNVRAGTSGMTRPGLGGASIHWNTGTSQRYFMFNPWDRAWMLNYIHDTCPGQSGHSEAYADPYTFTFMAHRDDRTRFIVYD